MSTPDTNHVTASEALADRLSEMSDTIEIVKQLQAARRAVVALHLAPPAEGWQAVREAMEAQLEQ